MEFDGMVSSGDEQMHKRLFHYAMLVYALGLIAAITLNVDVAEQTARAPVQGDGPGGKGAASDAMTNCATRPEVHVVATPAPASEHAETKAPCAARVQEVAPIVVPIAPEPAVIPVVEPTVRQNL
jgi:hypothetical protein